MSTELTLRPLTDGDIQNVGKWLTAPHVAEWFQHTDAWIDEIEKRNGEFDFISHFIIQADGRDIGFCQYYDYARGGESWHGTQPTDGTYSIDYMIGDADYLGMGFGTETVKILTRILLCRQNVQRVIVKPEPENLRSRKTLLSAGYAYDKENDLFIVSKR